MIGKLLNGPATMSYRLKGNQFIVGLRKSSYLGMLWIRVTGEHSFEWIAARKLHLMNDSTCASEEGFTFHCFKGQNQSQEDYDLELAAKKGKIVFLNRPFCTVLNYCKEKYKSTFIVLHSSVVSCFDTNDNAVDSYGDTCTWYEYNRYYCGDYDDDDFDARKMCCSCKSTGNIQCWFWGFLKEKSYMNIFKSRTIYFSTKLYMYKWTLWPDG